MNLLVKLVAKETESPTWVKQPLPDIRPHSPVRFRELYLSPFLAKPYHLFNNFNIFLGHRSPKYRALATICDGSRQRNSRLGVSTRSSTTKLQRDPTQTDDALEQMIASMGRMFNRRVLIGVGSVVGLLVVIPVLNYRNTNRTSSDYQTAVTTGLLNALFGLGMLGVFAWLFRRSLMPRQKVEAVHHEHDTGVTAEAFSHSEAQFRRAIEDASIPIIMHAEDGEMLAVSRAFRTISGYSQEDVPNFDTWLERAYGANASSVAVFVRGLFNSIDDSEEREFLITTKSGERAHLVLQGVGSCHPTRRA